MNRYFEAYGLMNVESYTQISELLVDISRHDAKTDLVTVPSV